MRSVASNETGPLPGNRATSLPLVGGRVCLDFTNTAHGRGTGNHMDHLVDYPALVGWSRHAGVLDDKAAKALLARAQGNRRAADASPRRREAMHRFLTAVTHNRDGDGADLALINAGLAEATPHARIVAAEGGFAWHWDEEPALDRMLWPIVRSAAELLTAADRRRIKQCPGRDCGWLFLDISKNGSRRWCEMEVCGSRAKARAYYARKRHDEKDAAASRS